MNMPAQALVVELLHFELAVAEPPRNAWQRAALLEGTGREPDAPSPWGDPVPWG